MENKVSRRRSESSVWKLRTERPVNRPRHFQMMSGKEQITRRCRPTEFHILPNMLTDDSTRNTLLLDVETQTAVEDSNTLPRMSENRTQVDAAKDNAFYSNFNTNQADALEEEGTCMSDIDYFPRVATISPLTVPTRAIQSQGKMQEQGPTQMQCGSNASLPQSTPHELFVWSCSADNPLPNRYVLHSNHALSYKI